MVGTRIVFDTLDVDLVIGCACTSFWQSSYIEEGKL
jgi:hypothetical protein